MSCHFRTLSLAAVSLAALVSAQGAAQAGAFGLREQSATGLGQAFAGVAAGEAGVSSLYWNPATITMNPGFQSEWHASAIVPRSDITPTYTVPGGLAGLGKSGDIGLDAVLPASYSSYQINDSLWVGLYTGAPYGLATKPNPIWAGQLYARTTSVISYEAMPTVGYKVNDWLSVGAGARVQYFKVRYFSAIGPTPTAPSPLAASAGLEGDDFGFGYSVGATLTPFAGTSIGIGYRSSVEQELDGKFQYFGVPITAKVVLPESVSVGLSQQVTDALTLSATAEWTNWSRLGFPRVYNDLTGGLLAQAPYLPLDYKDGWFFSVGGEYRINPSWAVRAGVAYEISPIDVDNRNPRLPDSDRVWVSLGATYNWSDNLSFDIAYSHLFSVGNTDINIAPGNSIFPTRGVVFAGDVDSSVDIVSASIKYRWDNPAQPIPAPIVRKY
ncbi:OmpP1/FadL family transporter [Microvirga pudoricolor]|uniref:OmpP1/FadL family transporter n=1 Tax=Microvirga pudoricolor TaxID=2778729 RepID=UPI00194F8832|nr:outer membrane protein transport protein [Microvirga pudoricolor]MBM6595630.1 transporter [Microvirga pudoricolor]